VQIPYTEISKDALRGIALEFVSREGTDYGEEWDMEKKIDQVIEAIKKGKVVIYYNHTTQTCNLLTKHQSTELEAARAAAQDDDINYND